MRNVILFLCFVVPGMMVPEVLVQLRKALIENEGLKTRVSPRGLALHAKD